jgi:hypothetical protein
MNTPNIKYGNCLLGIIILALTKGPGKVIFKKQKGTRIPHLMYQTSSGELWHYKKVRDILPGQLTIFWFEGKFEEKKKREKGLDNSKVI